MNDRRPASELDPAAVPPPRVSRLNVPNILCVIRLILAAAMVAAAIWQQTELFLSLAVAAMLTDFLDGRLAVAWHQQTTLGAILDSVADASMYFALALGTLLLRPAYIQRELAWLIATGVSYALASLAGWLKFKRLPSYHTRAAKTGWLLVTAGVIAVFAEGPPWILRAATVGVTLTNLESVAITCVLPAWRANVPSLYHAMRLRRGEISVEG